MRHNRTTLRHQGAAAVSVPAELAGVTVNTDTFHSIGITVDLGVSDDTDHNSTVAVEYKKSSSGTWLSAKSLERIDYQWNYSNPDQNTTSESFNNFAGSLMFLTPGTSYDIRLTYSDPQSSDPQHDAVYETTVSTLSLPVKPTGGTTYYVDNTGANGDGSSGSPWNSIANAQATVQPGDIVRIRSGTGSYTTADATAGTLTTSGTDGNWIVYEEDPADPGAVLDSLPLEHDCNYVWIDGLTFTYAGGLSNPYERIGGGPTPPGSSYGDAPGGPGSDWPDQDFWDDAAIYVPPPTPSSPNDGIIVTGCTITNYVHGVYSPYECNDWVVIDNAITGYWAANDWDVEVLSSGGGAGIGPGGEGNPGGSGHIIAYNTITQTADAVSVGGYNGGRNCDVYGNKIYDTLGNSVTFDNSYENMRCYGNIMMECGSFPVSMQPQRNGPWYYLYNQITLSDNPNFKWRVQDKLVFINNIFVPGYTQDGQFFTRCFMRNNLFLTEVQFVWTTKDDFPTDPFFNRESQWFTDAAASPKAGAPDAGAGWMGDIDYDGFDSGSTSNIVFRWNYDTGTATTDFSGPDPFTNLYAEVGIEENGILIDADLIFVAKTYNNPNVNLVLKSDVAYGGANPAAETGQAVDNLADFYGGAAPDRGCHDRANGPPHYGVRTSELGTALHLRTNDWTKH